MNGINKAALRFHFEADTPRKEWMPQLIRELRRFGYSECKIVGDALEITGFEADCMKTAVRVASMASLAYEGDVEFFKLGCGEICDYRIKLFPLRS